MVGRVTHIAESVIDCNLTKGSCKNQQLVCRPVIRQRVAKAVRRYFRVLVEQIVMAE